MRRVIAAAAVLMSATGCVSTRTLVREQRYGEACKRLRDGDPDGSERVALRAALASELQGDIRLHVLTAAEVQAAAGRAPEAYGATKTTTRWVVDGTLTLNRAPGSVQPMMAVRNAQSPWYSLGREEAIASALFGLPPPAGGESLDPDFGSAFLTVVTLGMVHPRSRGRLQQTPDPYQGDPRRQAADKLYGVALWQRPLRAPGSLQFRGFLQSRGRRTLLASDNLELWLDVFLPVGSGPWTCRATVYMRVPIRAGTSVREQLDGVEISLPPPADKVDRKPFG